MKRDRSWPNRCDRCDAELDVSTMSMFNTEVICMACQEREHRHPLYAQARDVERAACSRGDYNFPGIGCPPDLRIKES